MAVRSITIFQKSFSKLSQSSFETYADALAMWETDIASSATGWTEMTTRSDIEAYLKGGELVDLKGLLTDSKNGFKLIFIWTDKQWEVIRNQPLDPLPSDIGWTRTVLDPVYLISNSDGNDIDSASSWGSADYSKRLCDSCQTIFNEDAKEVFPV